MTPKGGGRNTTVSNHASKVSMNLVAALGTLPRLLVSTIDPSVGDGIAR